MAVHNLPHYATPFVGRVAAITEITKRLNDPDCRLLTLVGPGGIGKTRLAIQAALKYDGQFTNGVYFVPLQALNSADFLVSAIADAIGLQLHPGEDITQQLLDCLRERALLLILDNLEHLTDGVGLISEILNLAPQIFILATSRERLNLLEEWVFDVVELGYPASDTETDIEAYDAVRLFIRHAQRLQVNFELTPVQKPAVIRICRLVGGMPLGIELAAAWVRTLSCDRIADEIAHSLDILSTPIRNVEPRHRSMRAAFERSWTLMTDAEQAVFRRLAVFRGGFSLEGAEQVADATLAIMVSLVDKSLVQIDTNGRYDLHELLRQYAAEKLCDISEDDITVQRHRDYFVQLAERAEAHIFGREQIAWFDRLEVDLDNLRAVLIHLAENEAGLRLASAMGWFFSERTHWREGLDWLERLLAANPDAPTSLRAKAYQFAGALAFHPGLFKQTRALLEQALTLARAANDRWNIAWALSWLGLLERDERSIERSAVLLDESLALFRELDDPMGMTHTLIRRSWVARSLGDDLYAQLLLEEAEIRAREAGDLICAGWISLELGRIDWLDRRSLKQARIHLETSLSHFRQAHFPNGYIRSLTSLVQIEQDMGNWTRVQSLMNEVRISLQEVVLDNTFLCLVFSIMAHHAKWRGQFERAATLLSASTNDNLFQGVPFNRAGRAIETDPLIMAVRAQMGEEAFVKTWTASQTMTREQAIAYAIEGLTAPGEHSNTSSPARQTLPDPLSPHEQALAADDLTKREMEILGLLAEGYSNREIAERLVLTIGTVKDHVHNIYQKLGVHNRTRAIAHARQLRLLP